MRTTKISRARRKLSLARETLRQLDGRKLAEVAAGAEAVTSHPWSNCRACDPDPGPDNTWNP